MRLIEYSYIKKLSKKDLDNYDIILSAFCRSLNEVEHANKQMYSQFSKFADEILIKIIKKQIPKFADANFKIF